MTKNVLKNENYNLNPKCITSYNESENSIVIFFQKKTAQIKIEPNLDIEGQKTIPNQ